MAAAGVAPTPRIASLPAGFDNGDATGDFATGIYSFLNALPPNTLGRLYNTPASCLAIFRLLPLMARHLVLNMLWVESPFPRSDVETWASRHRTEGKRQLDETLLKLKRLHILREDSPFGTTNGNPAKIMLVLSQSFRDNFRRALTGGGNHRSFGVPIDTPPEDIVTIEQLDAHGTGKWETILHFMVGSNLETKPSQSVIALLQHSELMVSTNPRSTKFMTITSRGFQFLLEDVNTQLWDLLLQYLAMAETKNMDLVDVLASLFMLGSLELGREYSLSSLSQTQQQVLTDLLDFGLVLLTSSDRFYPTRLATTLTSSAPPLVSAQHASDDAGFLVLETNYRTYAYTSNPLQIAVLNLFTTLRYRYPNLVVGAITRESIKGALSNGITANQIIAYLSNHAHPQMRKAEPLLPPTVVDQIRLWELEKNRVKDFDGYLYEDFKSEADYELVVQYARQLGIIHWENVELRRFFVSQDGHNTLRDFIRRRMGGNA